MEKPNSEMSADEKRALTRWPNVPRMSDEEIEEMHAADRPYWQFVYPQSEVSPRVQRVANDLFKQLKAAKPDNEQGLTREEMEQVAHILKGWSRFFHPDHYSIMGIEPITYFFPSNRI